MESTAVSIGKSVLKGALGCAKSAIVEEAAMELGVQHDKAFITDELEMMQSFLMEAHDDERDELSKVVTTWVNQVRDVAYDVEDGLEDVVLRVHGQTWWGIPRTLLDRRHVAEQMKELRAKVEDVGQRNVRYRIINGASINTAAVDAMFGVDEATRHDVNQPESRPGIDLAQLILREDPGSGSGSGQIGVIGVWGTSGTAGHTSIILEAYDNPIIKVKFPCRAWVRVTRPFHQEEFVQSMVEQFRETVAGVADSPLKLEEAKTGWELARQHGACINKRHLIVLTDLSTIEEWHQIKACFPENKMGSQIVVSTEQVEVASLCSGQKSMVSKLKQLSADQTIYAFHQQSFQDTAYSSKAASSLVLSHTIENEIQEGQSYYEDDEMTMTQQSTAHTSNVHGHLEEIQLIGREKEKSEITELIREHSTTQQIQVIAVWGKGGVGKTTLIRDIYHSQEVNQVFEKHAYVTVLQPFELEKFLSSLAFELDVRNVGSTEVADYPGVLGGCLQEKNCLIILDDLSSTTQWDIILPSLLAMNRRRLVILIITRQEDIAKHCCEKTKCIRLLNGLEEKDACDLFTKSYETKILITSIQCPALGQVPVGIRELRSLDTLRCVHLEWENAIIQEIEGLTNLRKLGVYGIDRGNGPEFCSAISGLHRLESLFVQSSERDLCDILHGMSSPPENLRSLKLRGWMDELPQWIKLLQNLVKIKLELTEVSINDEDMRILGNLPNLSIMSIKETLFQSALPITFHSGLFRSLVVLELVYMEVEVGSLEFEATSMPKLETLNLRLIDCKTVFSGLELLPSIKEVQLLVFASPTFIVVKENMTEEEAEEEARYREDKVKEDMRKQLANNKNSPILKVQ
ncbi:hypothetical protein ZWY2020_023839 [Hordeum vulgare]|nr:hypothetical protein ZWY2020_023839 [Hordeum vulgare]